MKPIRSGAKLIVTIQASYLLRPRDKVACLFLIIQNCHNEHRHG
nr:MAG TPA: hypothetical protein [Caudoviricetes sp.]